MNPLVESVESIALWLVGREVGGYAVPPVLAMTDAIEPSDIGTVDPEITEVDKPKIRHYRVSPGIEIGTAIQKLEFSMLLAGDGNEAAGMLRPPLLIMLEACEMAVVESIDGTVTDHYQAKFTSRENQTSLSFELYRQILGEKDAKKITTNGCRFVWDFAIGVNELGMFNFAGMGLYQPEGVRTFTQPELDSISYGSSPAQCDAATGKNISATWNGIALDIQSIKIKTNRKLVALESALGEYGFTGVIINSDPGSNFECELNPFESTAAIFDPWVACFAGTKAPLIIVIITGNGTKYTFTGPETQIAPPERQDSDGVTRFGLKMLMTDCGSNADNALIIDIEKA